MKVKKRKRLIHIVSCLLCFVIMAAQIEPSCSYVVYAAEESESSYNIADYENNQILIQFREGLSSLQKSMVLNTVDASVVDEEENTYILEAGSTSTLKETLDTLYADTSIVNVQPNFTYDSSAVESEDRGTYTAGNKTVTYNQWGILNDGTQTFCDKYSTGTAQYIKAVAGIDTNIVPFWNYMSDKTSYTIVVALLDSGVDVSHEALQGNLWTNSGEIAGDGIDNDGNGYIDDYNGYNTYLGSSDITDEVYHGTHCAGIIAANGTNNVWGVTEGSKVKVMPVKVFSNVRRGDSSTTYATTFSLIRGIRYAEANGARVCNMSLGMSGDDTALATCMKNSSMLFVCAACNEGADLTDEPMYPAYYNYDNIISVANIRWDGTLYYNSNYSATRVTVAAPGTLIYSTIPGNDYEYMTGTSMSTPYVTGVAALLMSYIRNQSATTVKQRISVGAKKLSSLTGKVSSGGILDAYACISADVSKPTITKTITVYKTKGYATVKIKAADVGTAGLKYVRYMKGSKTAAAFSGGSNGTKISATGSFKVTSTGYYTVYAVDKNGNEKVIKFKVTIPVPTKVTLSKSTVTLKKGKTYKLSPKVTPTKIYVKYTYSSSKKTVAAVTSAGKITAKKAGTATITVKTQNGKKTTIKVKVKA